MVLCLRCLIPIQSWVGQEIWWCAQDMSCTLTWLQHSFKLHDATDRSKDQDVGLADLVCEVSICSLELASTTDELRQVHESPTSITSDAS